MRGAFIRVLFRGNWSSICERFQSRYCGGCDEVISIFFLDEMGVVSRRASDSLTSVVNEDIQSVIGTLNEMTECF